MGCARTWWEVAQWLTPYGWVVGPDARGHGRGPKAGPWHTEQFLADLEDLYEIAAEWGRRDYWSFVDRVKCPLLAIEGEHSAMPLGQQAEVAARVQGKPSRHLIVAGAGHVVHDDAPYEYRGAVEA